MKSLVIFYTRTGRTKKIAELIAKEANCEIEEVIDNKKRKGIFGYLKGGRDAIKENLTTINEASKNPEAYEIIVIGTPIWGEKMTPAIRTYITQYKSKFKKVAFFCTKGGDGAGLAFESMKKLCEKTPLSTLELTRAELKKGLYADKIKKFVQALK